MPETCYNSSAFIVQLIGVDVLKLLIRWFINALSLLAATNLVKGIEIIGSNGWVTLIVMAAVFGIVNAAIRPIVQLLSLPLVVVTLGLFTLVINALMLWFASWLSDAVFGASFHVAGFWPAFWGAIVISIVSWLLSIFFHDEDHSSSSRRRKSRR
ncbi:phage holin family protein [Chloroflexia bacterium SDU3-3]|nr:phage holin family protein [Chloroflexia bacterium SDU3-3]